MTAVLYQDKQVTIYKELMVINRYYFPLASSKTIMFEDIETVGLIDSEGVNHRWGLSGKYLNNWFPLDSDRKNKTKFIEITLKGRKTKPSITPDDAAKVFQIIWENHTKEGAAYSERMSEQGGKETEVAQQEMMEREQEAMQTTEQQLETGKSQKA